MENRQTQIKSHGWHAVTLTGNLLTGDTFKCSDFIKKYLGGKWDAARKGWIVDLTQVAKYTTPAGTIMVS
jgi:hypothetical protein